MIRIFSFSIGKGLVLPQAPFYCMGMCLNFTDGSTEIVSRFARRKLICICLPPVTPTKIQMRKASNNDAATSHDLFIVSEINPLMLFTFAIVYFVICIPFYFIVFLERNACCCDDEL